MSGRKVIAVACLAYLSSRSLVSAEDLSDAAGAGGTVTAIAAAADAAATTSKSATTNNTTTNYDRNH